MNRRGFLKCAGAITAAPLIGKFSGRAASAQAPMYEGEVIYRFTELAGPVYDFGTDGGIFDVSRNGVIVGRDRSGGQQVPCTWDLTGTRTILETGDLSFASVSSMVISPSGLIAGNLGLSIDGSDAQEAVFWTGGSAEVLPAEGATFASARAISDMGTVAGSIPSHGARWSDGILEKLEVPAGAVGTSIHCIGSNGDVPGFFTNDSLGIVGTPWRWNADGTVDDLGWPADLIAAAPEVISVLGTGIFGVFESGDFTLSAAWRNGETWSQRSWINSGGSYAPITSDGADVEFLALQPHSIDNIVGLLSMPDGTNQTVIWKDGVISNLAEVTTLPAGLTLGSVVGTTEDGSIVAIAVSADEMRQIVVLRPV